LDEWRMFVWQQCAVSSIHDRLTPEMGPCGMSSEAVIRVLVVDDHDLFRTGLRALLEEEGFEVADAVSGPAAARRVASLAPDVVVMDMNMPGMDGVDATRLVTQVAPRASVLMLTIATDEGRVVEALRAGASGYLLKDAPLEEIAAGIRAAAAGQSAISPRVAGAVVDSVRASGPEPPCNAVPALSSREREVLGLLAQGCDNAEIARRLFLSPSTVKNHVSKLLEKLGVDNRVQAATFAARHDLVHVD
jgi:DNA-binding NarL/FixJ family response regulator